MRSLYLFLLFSFVLFVGVSCDENDQLDTNELNYSLLKTALLEVDNDVLKTEINTYFSELKPEPTPADEYGYEKHFLSFVEALGKGEGISVVHSGYCSVETGIPISEISVTIHTDSGLVERTLDLTPIIKEKKTIGFELVRLHNIYE